MKRTVDEGYFTERVSTHGECWVWDRYVDACGYGRLAPVQGEVLAHRVAWLVFCGPIPKGMHVLHKCDTPACVNPAHLWLGSHQDNMADRGSKGRARGGSSPGVCSPVSKLTLADVRRIREGGDAVLLAKAYGVHKATIRRVMRGDTYGSDT